MSEFQNLSDKSLPNLNPQIQLSPEQIAVFQELTAKLQKIDSNLSGIKIAYNTLDVYNLREIKRLFKCRDNIELFHIVNTAIPGNTNNPAAKYVNILDSDGTRYGEIRQNLNRLSPIKFFAELNQLARENESKKSKDRQGKTLIAFDPIGDYLYTIDITSHPTDIEERLISTATELKSREELNQALANLLNSKRKDIAAEEVRKIEEWPKTATLMMSELKGYLNTYIAQKSVVDRTPKLNLVNRLISRTRGESLTQKHENENIPIRKAYLTGFNDSDIDDLKKLIKELEESSLKSISSEELNSFQFRFYRMGTLCKGASAYLS